MSWSCTVCRRSNDAGRFCRDCGHHKFMGMLAHVERDVEWLLNGKADHSWRIAWHDRAIRSAKQMLGYQKDIAIFHFRSSQWFKKQEDVPFLLVKKHEAEEKNQTPNHQKEEGLDYGEDEETKRDIFF